MEFKEMLREKIRELGMTQKMAAETLECSQVTVCQYLSGAIKPSKIISIEKLCTFLEVSFEELSVAVKTQDEG